MIPSRTRVAATALVAVFGASGAGWAVQSAQGATDDALIVRAEFADASPLLVGNDVKVKGVPVGEVAAMEPINDHAVVSILLDPTALPVHRDARFTIRPVSLLGERFVDLDRGSAAAPPLRPGDTVPISQTTTNTDLDQVLTTLDDPTGAGLAAMLTTLGDGLRDNGANTAATLKALSPALTDTESFARVLHDQNAVLNQLVERLEPVLTALAADEGRRLDHLVGTAGDLFAATAEQQRQLEATLAELPAALSSAISALDQVTGTAAQTTPTLRSLRPVTDDLTAISAELHSFSDALDPALTSAQPVLERGRDLLEQARPVVADLHRAGPDVRTTPDSARPIVGDLANNLSNVYNFLRFWAQTANGGDGLSNYFRGFVVVNPQSGTGLLPAGLPAPPLPGATGQPAPPGSGAELLSPHGLLKPEQPATGADKERPGATGLSEDQEHGMFGLLLGGGR